MAFFICRDAVADELFFNRLFIDLLHESGHFGVGHFSDFFEDFIRVFIAGLDAVEVQDSEAAELVQVGNDFNIDDGVHRGGHERNLEGVIADLEVRVGLVGVEGNVPGDNSHLVETIGLLKGFKLGEGFSAAHICAHNYNKKRKQNATPIFTYLTPGPLSSPYILRKYFLFGWRGGVVLLEVWRAAASEPNLV